VIAIGLPSTRSQQEAGGSWEGQAWRGGLRGSYAAAGGGVTAGGHWDPAVTGSRRALYAACLHRFEQYRLSRPRGSAAPHFGHVVIVAAVINSSFYCELAQGSLAQPSGYAHRTGESWGRRLSLSFFTGKLRGSLAADG
jgi:hypothetical protein